MTGGIISALMAWNTIQIGNLAAIWDIEPGQAVPSIGAASLLVVVLRMVYKDNADRRQIESDLREEFRQAREEMIKEHNFEMDRQEHRHRLEIQDLRAQINELRAEIRQLKGIQ